MNHWLENANLKRLREKYPIGCKIEGHIKKFNRTFEGIVKGHRVYYKRTYVYIDIDGDFDIRTREENIVRILQEAGKEDE